MAGLEAEYNDLLKGTDGLQQVRKDPFNNIFAYVGAPKKATCARILSSYHDQLPNAGNCRRGA
jgi:hypothetical protein